MTDTDVVIVGGGPAGLHAAVRLARAGFGVMLFEEHHAVGEPVHCTGVLAREAFEEFGVPTEPILNELTAVRFYAPSGETVEYSTPTAQAVVVDRARFDAMLAVKARAAGVAIVCGERVTRVDVGAARVTVRAGAHQARGRVCVLACGASYAVQRKLGLGMPRLLLHSAQAELPAARLGEVEVHFGAEVAPRGFAWAVPVGRDRPGVRIGVMCEGEPGRYFARAAAAIGPRWGVDPGRACAPRQKILPLGPIDRTYADRIVVLGDAAGLVKPTTGGGIYYSLLSAALAADTLARALHRDELGAESLSEYERGWRQRLGAELRWQLVLRRLAQRMSDADIDRLFELARTDGVMPLVRRTAAFNHHRELIVALLRHPPARRVLLRTVLA